MNGINRALAIILFLLLVDVGHGARAQGLSAIFGQLDPKILSQQPQNPLQQQQQIQRWQNLQAVQQQMFEIALGTGSATTTAAAGAAAGAAAAEQQQLSGLSAILGQLDPGILSQQPQNPLQQQQQQIQRWQNLQDAQQKIFKITVDNLVNMNGDLANTTFEVPADIVSQSNAIASQIAALDFPVASVSTASAQNSVAFLPIYQNDPLSNYRAPSSAGIDGFSPTTGQYFLNGNPNNNIGLQYPTTNFSPISASLCGR